MDVFSDLIAGVSTIVFAISGVVVVVAVSLSRFLNSGRIKNLADAARSGIADPSLRSELEQALHRAILGRLGRMGESFVDRCRDRTHPQRVLFILGSVFSLLAIAIVAYSAGSSVVLDAMRSWAIDSVVAYGHGAWFMITDMSQNIFGAVVLAISLSAVLWIVLFVFSRLVIVWQISKNVAGVPEPVSPDRYDVIVSAIGLIFPFAILANVLFMFHYSGVYANFRTIVRDRYDNIVLSTGVDGQEVLKAEVPFDPTNDSQVKLVVAALLAEVVSRSQVCSLDRGSPSEQARIEVALIDKIARSVSDEWVRFFTAQAYFNRFDCIAWITRSADNPFAGMLEEFDQMKPSL